MAEFTKNNILNQAAQAMLAQANSLPQGVLQLLKYDCLQGVRRGNRLDHDRVNCWKILRALYATTESETADVTA